MHRSLRHVPNVLTVARLCALPVIVWSYGLHAPAACWTTAWIVLVAGLSDVADGNIARRLGAQSEFGRWVDPVVDRLFFFTVVEMLWYFGVLPWWAALPLLVRDGVILLLALPMRQFTEAKPEVSRLGKAANFVLICALEWFIIDARAAGWAFLAVGGSLYVASGLLYGYRALTWGRRHSGAPA